MVFIVKTILSCQCTVPVHRKVMVWLPKPLDFRWKPLSKSHEKQVKNFIIFILCCKCIIWCWWAWKVYGNVSGTLQTRKTVKIASCFGQIDYNRILNTNAHRLMCIMSAAFWGAPKHRTQNDLPSRLFTFRIIPRNPEIRPRSFLCSFNANTSFAGDVRQTLSPTRSCNLDFFKHLDEICSYLPGANHMQRAEY